MCHEKLTNHNATNQPTSPETTKGTNQPPNRMVTPLHSLQTKFLRVFAIKQREFRGLTK